MNELVQLVYVSSCRDLLSEEELEELLVHARVRNNLHGITGMLLYHDGNVMQAIEGLEQDVDQLISNIQSDPRHSRVQVLIKEVIEQRDFPDWSMSYQKLSQEHVEGFSSFMLSGRDAIIAPKLVGKARILLNSFRRNR